MRRIASVFGRRDKDRAVPQPVPPPPTPPPVPSLVSEQASSASSNGSALQTPDDYGPVLTRTPTKSKSFTAWLSKKSGTIKRGRPVDHNTPLDQLYVVEPVSDWRPTQPAPILHAPPTPKSQLKPPVLDVDIDIDSDEDASASGSDDDESVPRSAPVLYPTITPTSVAVAQSRKNLETLIQNSLVPPLALSTPFSHIAGTPMYPRSSNPPHSLPARQTMQTAMHRSLLLRRLQQPGVSALSVAQELNHSILPFASRESPTPVDPPSLPWFNDRVLPAAMRLSPSSPGLRRWMARPCFEERIAVWVPLNGVVTCQPVTGSSCAVAELEYSAALDAMIGFPLSPVEEEAPSLVAVAPVPTPQQPQPAAAAPAAVRSTSYQAVPSPLRNSTIESPKSPVPETPAPPSIATSPDFPAPQSPPAATTPTASRVRFVEDDKEDVIPLGYALRLKKRREEKAKFLREEQERRVHEEEKAKQEEERLRREQERRQWEEEKRAWEKEKRAMEEERKRRIYAEEVVAARVRREQQRAGGGYGAGETSLAASSSTTSLRDERNKQDNRRYSRPLHDQQGPWRQASEPAVPQHANTPSSSPHTSSPGSSRPPSIAGHQAGSLRGNSSRPPSVHNTSSEDVRQSTRAGKRSSMASLPGKMPNNQFDWSSYATLSASNPTLMVPPVPPVPMYAMDMPLLPPTPAFMLHQYPRPRSQNSQNSQSPGPSSPSASSSRQRLPSNGSSERVNVQHQQHSSSPSSRRGSNASSSSPIRPIASHQRRSSDDARRTSMPPPKDPQHERGRSQPSSLRSPSSSSLPRGRPPMPSSYQQPSPWSAPPLATSYSQQQLSPAAIINGYGQRAPPKANRRQTTIS